MATFAGNVTIARKRGNIFIFAGDVTIAPKEHGSPSPGHRPGRRWCKRTTLSAQRANRSSNRWPVGPVLGPAGSPSPGWCPGLGEPQGLRPPNPLPRILAALFFSGGPSEASAGLGFATPFQKRVRSRAIRPAPSGVPTRASNDGCRNVSPRFWRLGVAKPPCSFTAWINMYTQLHYLAERKADFNSDSWTSGKGRSSSRGCHCWLVQQCRSRIAERSQVARRMVERAWLATPDGTAGQASSGTRAKPPARLWHGSICIRPYTI